MMATAAPMRVDSLKRKITTRLPTPGSGTAEERSFAPPAEHPSKVIRHEEFARRLEIACDGNNHCPPKHRGRLGWIATELAKEDHTVSEESVRKWTSGEAKPKPDKMKALAKLLEVDEAWLSLGISPELAPRELRARNSMAAGSVNVVAGLLQMNGGHPAFPEANDRRAADAHIDLYAIFRGAQYAFHVNLAQDLGEQNYRFTVPINYQDAFQMGVVQLGATELALFELNEELVSKGVRKGGAIEVVLTLGEVLERRIVDFTKRI